MNVTLVVTNRGTKVSLMFVQNPEDKIRYAPDDPPAAAAAPESPPSAAPASGSSAQPETTTPAAAPSTTANVAATGSPQPAVAAPSWLAPFQAAGFAEKDEARATEALLQSYRDAERLRPMAPALAAYQQHAAQFQRTMTLSQGGGTIRYFSQSRGQHDLDSVPLLHPVELEM